MQAIRRHRRQSGGAEMMDSRSPGKINRNTPRQFLATGQVIRQHGHYGRRCPRRISPEYTEALHGCLAGDPATQKSRLQNPQRKNRFAVTVYTAISRTTVRHDKPSGPEFEDSGPLFMFSASPGILPASTYSCSVSGSATRMRPQYSQTMIFLPWRMST